MNLTPLRLAFLAFSVCAPLLWATDVRAQDPVKDLEIALRIDPQQLTDPIDRHKQVKAIVPKLTTLTDLRAAYFLKEWLPHVKFDKDTKKYLDEEMFKQRQSIGTALEAAIRKIAADGADQKIAVAVMIAEMAEREQSDERSKTGKFASVFADLLIAGKTGASFADSPEPLVRQAAWHAAGKITPKPNETLRKRLHDALSSPEVGVRRVAAYALTDLIKNAHHFEERDDEFDTVLIAITSATFGLREIEKPEDEWVRGYCLQALQQAARIFIDYGKATETAVHLDVQKDESLVLHPKSSKIFEAMNAANPRVAASLRMEPVNSNKLRLVALETLNLTVNARLKIIEKLGEKDLEVPAEKRVYRADLFRKYKTTDPISYFLTVDNAKKESAETHWNWEIVPTLMDAGNDVRLRRGSVLLLEAIAEDIESAQGDKKLTKDVTPEMRRRLARAIARGLNDSDYIVRWSATRTMRFVSRNNLDAEIIRDLGRLLIDREPRLDSRFVRREERDPNLSATAVATLEAISSSEHAWHAVEFLKSAVVDPLTDVEIRVAALGTLVQIGRAADRFTDEGKKQIAKTAVNSAFPQVTSVLANREEDVRLRRAASAALGQIGQPATTDIANEAVNVLKIAMRDDDAQIRQQASEALLSIRVP